MTPTQVVDLVREALMASFWLSAPLLALGFVAGIVISLIQVLTSLQDPAIGSLPRLAVYLFGFILLLPWMIAQWINYASGLFGNFAMYAN